MDLLFKCTGTTADDKIIRNSNLPGHYPSVNGNMAWDNLEAYIRQATEEYVIPFLGETFYQDLYNHYDLGPTDALKDKILLKVQDAIAMYAIYDAAPNLNGIISDLGLRENMNENSMPMSQWRYKSLRWNLILKADKSLDMALEVMEDNVDDAFLTNWVNDSAYNDAGHPIFRTTRELKKYLNIDGRRAFLALLPYLRKAEPTIVNILCSGEYLDMKTDIAAVTPQQKYLDLLDKVKPVLAEKAFLMAVPHISVVYDGSGFKLVSRTDSFDSRSNMLNTFGRDGIDMIREQVEKDLAIYQEELYHFLNNNPDDYPTWKADMYIEDPEGDTLLNSEDCIGGIFI